ncbi:GntR family transcriptional regulator [Phenylobacterium sp.]|uniref:GntR family transcriptional regulator n=1 Tax=Phenylobacterium sp. TaxID=1871053 RepID=UPI003D26E845
MKANTAERDMRSPPEIARSVRAMIVSGDLRPGDHLSTIELANRFGVSRGPVREALRLLESRALVRILPRKGAFVNSLQDDEVGVTLEAREFIFAALAELAAERATRGNLLELRRKLQVLGKLASKPTTTANEFKLATYDYVQVLYGAAHNARLNQIMRDLSEGVGHAFGHLSMATQEMRSAEYEAYRDLTDAVAQRDRTKAYDLARRMHAAGVARARQLQAAIPAAVVEFKGRRRRSRLVAATT